MDEDERYPDVEDLEYAKEAVLIAALRWRAALSPKDAKAAVELLDASSHLDRAIAQYELLKSAVVTHLKGNEAHKEST